MPLRLLPVSVREAAMGLAGLVIGPAVAILAFIARRSAGKLQACDPSAESSVASAQPALTDMTKVSDEKELSLAARADHILALLKKYEPVMVEGMDPSLHYLAPHVPRPTWSSLGDLVAAREKGTTGSVDGSRWISLRLDGSGFSSAMRAMRRNRVLPEVEGFSDVFAAAMRTCLLKLMEHTHAVLGYTQSDEIIVFVAPASIVRGEQTQHMRSGRVTKTTTLAASLVTAKFNLCLAKLCASSGVELSALDNILPHFDCRMGSWESWQEARALLLWRAYDCSVNGVSDAVHQMKGSGKHINSLGKREKVEWLWKQGRLPLPHHQAYGTMFACVKRVVEGRNPKLDKAVRTLRNTIEQVKGPVIELARKDALFPTDDILDEAES